LTSDDWRSRIVELVLVKQRLQEVDSQHLWQYRLPSLAAKESELLELESKLGEPLDSSHRSFLSHANGWPAFYQTVDLFGVEDLVGGPRFDHARDMLHAVEDKVLATTNIRRDQLMPIACSPVDLDLFVIARPSAVHPGVVLWLAGYVVESFPGFDDYFAAMVDFNRLEIVELQKHQP